MLELESLHPLPSALATLLPLQPCPAGVRSGSGTVSSPASHTVQSALLQLSSSGQMGQSHTRLTLKYRKYGVRARGCPVQQMAVSGFEETDAGYCTKGCFGNTTQQLGAQAA